MNYYIKVHETVEHFTISIMDASYELKPAQLFREKVNVHLK